MPASGGSQTVARAFEVLSCFKSGPSSLGLTEISRRVGLSTTIVHRLLRSLVDAGFLEQDERTSRYHLGVGLASLAEVFLRQRRLDLAEPELRRLSDEAGGSAGLAMRDGRDALILVYAPSTAPGAGQERPRRVPLHLSAMGKVLLAFGDPDDSGGLEALAPLATPTERSIASVPELRRALDRIREQGYAVSDRETAPDQLTVAIPIFDEAGRIYLALGMRLRWSPEEEARIDEVRKMLERSRDRLHEVLVPRLEPAPPAVNGKG
ncbi:MAG TPA: IclR family transcriptional regulator [Acidimicrobiales bacterium]